MSETPDPVARINALTTNARNTWFVLLGVLVFVSITLMGVEHIDFYGVDRATALPLVNVSVPTWLFFYAAPLLITAVYGYFHLYLIRLWDVLGAAEADIDGTPLGDSITPWLVTDVALKLRATTRDPDCITPRAMEVPNAIWNTLFAWIAGPAVLGWLWWGSMPARDWKMTATAGACLIGVIAFGYASAAMMRRRMELSDNASHRVWREAPAMALLIVLLATIPPLTYGRTSGKAETLAKIDLTGEALVEKPAGWLPYPIARKDFLAIWCDRERIADCNQPKDRQGDFDAEWNTRRSAALIALKKPRWSDKDAFPADFREADLSGAFLSGSNLLNANMKGANLWQAQMEGSVLTGAQLEGANLFGAQLQRAHFIWANMQGADLSHAQMDEAVLFEAQLQKANFSEAQMRSADLRNAQMRSADLRWAQLQGANFREAQMQGTNLSGALLQFAEFREAQMFGANLSGAQMQGANFLDAQMKRADLRQARMAGANLRRTQMQGGYLHGVHMQRAELFKTQMQKAILNAAQMQGATILEARMEGVQLIKTQMTGANLQWSILSGTLENPTPLFGTNLSGSTNNGSALRYLDLAEANIDAETDWRNVFLDASVNVPLEMRGQIGTSCHWDWANQNTEPLTDAEFFGRWRGWLNLDPAWNDRRWRHLKSVPEGWRDVPPLAPPEGCAWHTDPLPGIKQDSGD